MSDELLDRLTAARPDVAPDLLDPDNQLLEEILMTEPTSPGRRYVTPFRLGAVAAVAAALVAVLLVVPRDDPQPRTSAVPALHMRRIVESTTAALSSGRAHVHSETTADKSGVQNSTADFVVEFSGDNRSMAGTIDPGDGRSSAFPIANKIVNGQFYLEDGTRWVRDTNASNMSGSDIFSVDPRNFLAGVADAAAFETVDPRETVDSVEVRHLRATKPADVPDFNLGLGPRGEMRLTAFELWVDADDVVRGLLVKAEQTQHTYPNAKPAHLEKRADGTLQKVISDGDLGAPVDVRITTAYKVSFTDIGAPIDLAPPASYVDIAGKG